MTEGKMIVDTFLRVKSCGECPLYAEYYETCDHPFVKDEDVVKKPTYNKVPEWCPLKRGSLTLEILEK